MARFDNLGQALVTLRMARQWTQAELALRADLTPAMLSAYERGLRMPSLNSLGRILDALGTHPGELERHLDRLNDREAPPPEEVAPGGLPGVDLYRFLDEPRLPPDLAHVFREIVAGFQTVARQLLRTVLKARDRRG